MLAGLPKELNAKLENIHFIGSSNRVSALDICPPIVEDLFRLETEGIVTYDAHLREDVLAVAPVLCVLCDNPRASEITNHRGCTARKFCRMCMVRLMSITII